MKKICPLMSSPVRMNDYDDATQFVARPCLEEQCAWWIPKKEEQPACCVVIDTAISQRAVIYKKGAY